MLDAYEDLARHIEALVAERGRVLIYAGKLTIDPVEFHRDDAHKRLAWTVDRDGRQFILDLASVYAVEEVEKGVPPSAWLEG